MGLGAFVILVGGKTAIFIRFFGIMPSLEDHQVLYLIDKHSDVETTIFVRICNKMIKLEVLHVQ